MRALRIVRKVQEDAVVHVEDNVRKDGPGRPLVQARLQSF
jgi:hypothetical protein